ncbi:baseplate J/gp47 family protein [Lysobacter cavernae]|uniref:Baseplate J/gp47 family protein n=1 Tax=Lysobacter cavernae TaxID=1685901 RepID=A0ABV7RNF7_9GAMM
MSTFTAVDLSRLPAPAIVEPIDYEVILADMVADLRARDPQFTALAESEPAYKLLEVAAYREMQVRQRCNEAARAVMLAYAGGADLDQLGALLGVTRLQLDPGNPAQSIPPTLESDLEFRRRIQLAPEGFSVAGPEGAYIFHALSADPGVLDASATSPTPGEVVVTVLARAGDGTASVALVNAVATKLADDAVRPLTDHVTVQAATIVPYALNATVYTYAGPDSALVLAESQRRLERYVEESHRLGRDVPLSGIYSVLHSEGVQRVEITSPAAGLVIDRTQASWCSSITIVAGGVDE